VQIWEVGKEGERRVDHGISEDIAGLGEDEFGGADERRDERGLVKGKTGGEGGIAGAGGGEDRDVEVVEEQRKAQGSMGFGEEGLGFERAKGKMRKDVRPQFRWEDDSRLIGDITDILGFLLLVSCISVRIAF
jgi:hypothetical protein